MRFPVDQSYNTVLCGSLWPSPTAVWFPEWSSPDVLWFLWIQSYCCVVPMDQVLLLYGSHGSGPTILLFCGFYWPQVLHTINPCLVCFMILIDPVILFCNSHGSRPTIVRYSVLLCSFKLYSFFNMSMHKLIEPTIPSVLRCSLKHPFLLLVRITTPSYAYWLLTAGSQQESKLCFLWSQLWWSYETPVLDSYQNLHNEWMNGLRGREDIPKRHQRTFVIHSSPWKRRLDYVWIHFTTDNTGKQRWHLNTPTY